MSNEKYESEVNETLEMTKILDHFFDAENQMEQEKTPTQDFDDDSFWENYDFELVLDGKKINLPQWNFQLCDIKYMPTYRCICLPSGQKITTQEIVNRTKIVQPKSVRKEKKC